MKRLASIIPLIIFLIIGLAIAAVSALLLIAGLHFFVVQSEPLRQLTGLELKDLVGPTIALLGVIGALYIFYRTSRQNSKQLRRQHSVQVLFETRYSDGFREDMERRQRYFPWGETVNAPRYERFMKGLGDDGDTADITLQKRQSAQSLLGILNFWENVCALIEIGDLDEQAIRETSRAQMCSFVTNTMDVIHSYNAKNSLAYKNLLIVFARWE